MKHTNIRTLILSLFFLLFISLSTFAGGKLRIVSLAPNWTNTVAALGAADELVGVTRYCIFPDSIPSMVQQGRLASIGGFMDINLARVDSLKPDLVLTCTGMQKHLRDRFLKKGIKVIHMEESSLEEVYAKINELGQAIDKKENAGRLVTEIRDELKSVQDKYKDKPRVRVYYEINYCYKCVPGKDSYITELIRMVGGDPIFSDRPGIAPTVTWEEVVKQNPEVILIPIWAHAGGPYLNSPECGNGTTTPHEIAARPGADSVSAVINGRVRYINSAKTKQAGPQIPIAAELFARTIHADGDRELLKMDKVPENMETTFSFLFYRNGFLFAGLNN
ncbi:MAG: ABC transporter substrate-binding protein [Ignavibacteriales bacterium]